ncbi:MAG: sulfatase [Verrucomicrobiota bacterium]
MSGVLIWRVVALVVVVLLSATALAPAERPNVVLFVVDDLGWMDIGCQGSDYYQTPHIDALAESGVRFTDAYAACAVCSPTRAAILTGKYPARLLLTQWLPAGRWSAEEHSMKEGRFVRSLPLEEITLAEALREEGYATFHVGKWHLGGAPFSLPEHHGFDENVGGDDHGAPGSYFFPFKGKWKLPTTGVNVAKQAFDGGEEGDFLTDLMAEEAGRLIRANGDTPFFLYLPFYAVHTPIQGKEEKAVRYEAVPEAERPGSPIYAAMVESVDDGVGHVMSVLRELGLEEDTLVIFTSDNGGKAGDNAPLRANKGSHYEGGIRVPLIFSGAGVKGRGVESDLPVTSSDLYPTILEVLGLESRPLQHVDGVSLAELLRGGEEPDRNAIFWHYPHYNRHPQNAPVSIIRRGSLKLIEFLESGSVELYDLSEDIGESQDLSASEPEIAAELLRELHEWKEETGADPMRPNPQYQEHQ